MGKWDGPRKKKPGGPRWRGSIFTTATASLTPRSQHKSENQRLLLELAHQEESFNRVFKSAPAVSTTLPNTPKVLPPPPGVPPPPNTAAATAAAAAAAAAAAHGTGSAGKRGSSGKGLEPLPKGAMSPAAKKATKP